MSATEAIRIMQEGQVPVPVARPAFALTLRDAGTPRLDWAVMQTLLRAGKPIKTHDVGRHVGFAKPKPETTKTTQWSWNGPHYCTAILDTLRRMEAQGLVERVGPSAERTRRHRWALTAEGLAWLAL